MEFKNTRQALEKIESGDENCTLKSILGILVLDLNTDIKRELNVSCENLPVTEEEETEVMTRLTNLANLVGHIYDSNAEVFSNDKAKSRFDKKYLKLSELIDKTTAVEEEQEKLRKEDQEIERENARLDSLLKQNKTIEEQLEEKRVLQKSLENDLAQVDQLKKEIEEIRAVAIPGVEDEIKDLREHRLPRIQEELGMQQQRKEDLKTLLDSLSNEYQTESRNSHELELQIKAKKEEMDNLVREQERLTRQAEEWQQDQMSKITSLRSEEDLLKRQDDQNRKNIKNLEEAIKNLKYECENEERSIERLKLDKHKEDDLTNEIKGHRSRLESELNALRRNNGEEIGKNKDIQDKIDSYRDKKKNEEKSRNELIRQLNEIQEEITDIKKQSEQIDLGRMKLKEEEEAIREELRVKKDSYHEYKEQIRNKKAEFQRFKNAALAMVRNKEEQTKVFKKQQEVFGERIKKLIGDAQILMYADTVDLEEMKNKLISQQHDLDNQLAEELRSYQELIESVEVSIN